MNIQTTALVEQCGPYLIGPDVAETTAERHLSEIVVKRFVGEAVERYNEPWRAHHVVQHLGDIIGFLVDNIDELHSPRPTLWAAVGHDSIYVPQAPAGVNEELSAQLTTAQLQSFLPSDEVGLVGHYIRKTADHEWDGHDSDLAFFLDADLKILGAPAEEFDKYDENIRKEYSFVDQEVYQGERAGILRGFYDQKRLFITDVAFEQFEDQAKANLERKLDQLAAS